MSEEIKACQDFMNTLDAKLVPMPEDVGGKHIDNFWTAVERAFVAGANTRQAAPLTDHTELIGELEQIKAILHSDYHGAAQIIEPMTKAITARGKT